MAGAFKFSFSSRSSSPSSSSSRPSPSSDDADAEPVEPDPAQLEQLCLEEFGFNLRELKDRLRLHSEDLQSSLDAFCTLVLQTRDATRRREVAKSFIQGIAHITRLATDQSISTLVEMQSTFLECVQKENDSLLNKNDLLRSKLARFEDEAADLKCALQRSEAEKESIETKAREQFEEEKAVLEVSLREELRACKICEVNPRNVVIMPCFHAQYCAECLEGHQRNNNTCPSCRGIIRGTMPYIA